MRPVLGKECAADLFLPLAIEPTENLKTDATQGLIERGRGRERKKIQIQVHINGCLEIFCSL